MVLSSSIIENIKLIRCVQKSRFFVHEGPNSSGSTVGLGGAAAAVAAAAAAAVVAVVAAAA